MNVYTYLDNSELDLDRVDPQELAIIHPMVAEATELLQSCTRTKLQYALFDALKRWNGEINVLFLDDQETKLTSSVFSVLGDLHARYECATGAELSFKATFPVPPPKEWTGDLEHFVYVFQVAQEVLHRFDAPLQYFISRIRICDEPQTHVQDGLEEAHQVRGRKLIGSFDVFKWPRDVDEIDIIRREFRQDADLFLTDVFGHSFEYGIECEDTGEESNPAALASFIHCHQITEAIEEQTQTDVHGLLDRLWDTAVKQGMAGRKRGLV